MRRRALPRYFGVILAALLSSAAPLAAQDAGDSPPPATAPAADVKKADAQDPLIQLTTRLPETLQLGEPLALTFLITHPPTLKLLPPAELDTSRLGLIDAKLVPLPQNAERPLPDGLTTTELRLVLTSWRVGTVRLSTGIAIPSINDQGQPLELRSPPLELKVLSLVDKGDSAELSAPRPPYVITTRDTTPAWVALGLSSLATAIALIALFMRRRLRVEPAPPPPPSIHSAATAALEALAASTLLEDGEVVTFHTRLSEIVREYLGARYGFPGAESTTSEIARALEAKRLPPSLSQREIAQWLRERDRIKFASLRLPREDSEAALQRAFAFVELTRQLLPSPLQDGRAADSDPATPTTETPPPSDAPDTPVEPDDADTAEAISGAPELPEDSIQANDVQEPVERSGSEASAAPDVERLNSSALGALDWATLSSVVEGLAEGAGDDDADDGDGSGADEKAREGGEGEVSR